MATPDVGSVHEYVAVTTSPTVKLAPVSGAVNALEIVYAHSVLQVGDVGFGLLLSAWGGGLCVGSLFSGWLGARVATCGAVNRNITSSSAMTGAVTRADGVGGVLANTTTKLAR